MKITIFGAGATGGAFAVRLMQAGHEVTVIARGPHLEAIRSGGLTLLSGDDRTTVHPRALADAGDAVVQDVVLVGVKATALASLAQALAPLIGPETMVIFPQNGMPWWYPVGDPPPAGRPAAPDLPDFRLADVFLEHMTARQLAGGSIYSANQLDAPGIVRNTSPGSNRLDLGPVTGDGPPGLDAFRAALEAGGIASPVPDDIRATVWRKLLVNMSGSLIALLTERQSSVSRRDAALGQIYRRLVDEGLSVAAAHGYDLRAEVDADALLAGTFDHKPSLLQDYEAGRPMEIAQIVLAPQAFGRIAGIATPTLDALAAIAARRARDAGLLD